MLSIRNSVVDDFILYANASTNEEVAGLLVGYINKHMIDYFIPIKNISKFSNKNFVLDPKSFISAIYEIQLAEAEFIGVIHSHPSSLPYPSRKDMLNWHYPKLSYWIYSLTDEKLNAYYLINENIIPLKYKIVD